MTKKQEFPGQKRITFWLQEDLKNEFIRLLEEETWRDNMSYHFQNYVYNYVKTKNPNFKSSQMTLIK